MTKAMILSAGRGERLRPLTDRMPKPLCELNGKSLIVHHLENLKKSGIKEVVINHAWLGGKIRQSLKNGSAFGLSIEYAPEPPGGLETAGGIINALPLLGKDPFLVLNGDIYCDYDLSRMLPLQENHLANLVLIPKDPRLSHPGDFGLDENRKVINKNQEYTFSGIACYHPDFFNNLPFGRYSLTPFLRALVEKGFVQGEMHAGVWFDIGSFSRFRAAMEYLAQG